MYRGHIIEQEYRSPKALVLGSIALLILAIGLGTILGMGLARAFDSMDLEDRARQFDTPQAAAPVVPGSLRA